MLRTISNYSNYNIRVTRRFEQHPTSMQLYHYHNYYELYYLFSGERYYFIKDKTYHIKKGDLVLIKEYVTHCSAAAKNQPYKRVLVDFKKEFLSELNAVFAQDDLFHCFNNQIHVISVRPGDQPTLEHLLTDMVNEYKEKRPGYVSYLKASVAQMLLLANRHSDRRVEYNTDYMNQTHKIVAEAVGYINNNYNEDINLELISGKFFISTHYFSRIFKKSTGMTFIEYLNGIRIKEAQKLLATTRLSISEISERVGYKSSTHFGRLFKQLTKTSPREYRNLDHNNDKI